MGQIKNIKLHIVTDIKICAMYSASTSMRLHGKILQSIKRGARGAKKSRVLSSSFVNKRQAHSAVSAESFLNGSSATYVDQVLQCRDSVGPRGTQKSWLLVPRSTSH